MKWVLTPTGFFQQHWLKVGSLLTIVLFGEFIGVWQPLRALGERFIVPIDALGVKVVSLLNLPIHVATQRWQIYEENQELEKEYADVLARAAQLDRLQKENDDLRAALNAAPVKRNQTIIAPIVSYTQPTVGVGSADGLQVGNPVLLHGTVIGRVQTVSAHQAEVVLLSERQSTPLLSKTQTGITGTVVGDSKHAVLTQLPIDAELHVGDAVTTIGQNDMPGDLSVGRVQSIDRPQNAPVQTATLDQLVSFYDAQTVEVLIQ